MKTQKWMLVASIILFLGAAGLVAFTVFTPFAWAQGPMGWNGRGDGPMFDGGFGMGRGMMQGGGFGMGPGGMMGGRWGGPENSLVTIAAEKLGLTTTELQAELQAGKTIADVAAEKKVEVSTIVDAVVADRTEQLNELVANGQATQEEADAMLALMKANITRRINEAWSGRGFGPGMMDGGMGPGFGMGPGGGRGGMMGGRGGMMGGWGGPGNSMMQTVADTLGLTPTELVTELRAGKSVAEVAAEKNVEMATLVNAILTPRTEQLNALVAKGQLTQAEVDARITILKVDIVERLNQSWGAKNTASGGAETY
ncbi:MAG: hypothetical protein Fur0044_36540 [Anaerolineae bacterium]|nr:hypothetical protein [Anaerolineales bacterium]MCQ3974516.1 hypothetical protein [Anaerolineae bacterium]